MDTKAEMTRDDILNMPAGREMDALIAKRIFEHELFSLYSDDDLHFQDGESQDGIQAWRIVPRYSTDIAAAWEVVERLKDIKPVISYDPYPDKWYVRFNGSQSYSDKAAPLAICRAALMTEMK